MDTVVFAAGGTGGHIIPALTTARYFKKIMPEMSVLFIGSGGALERKLMENVEFDYIPIEAQAILGKGIKGFFKLLKGLLPNLNQIFQIYKSSSVKLVIGFGGFPSFSPVLAAKLIGLPCFIFEQNAKTGLANKILSLFVSEIFAVPGSSGFIRKNIVRVLNPVREEFKIIDTWRCPDIGSKIRILVIGGSQGAQSLNSEIMLLRDFIESVDIQLVHQTGTKDFHRVSKYYSKCSNISAKEYIEDIVAEFARADLIICRAGAGAVSEIISTRRPAIFVPLNISQGHQKYNALHLVKGGAALMFTQDNDLNYMLKEALEDFLGHREKLQLMHNAFINVKELNGVSDGAVVISELARKVLESRRK